jgi:choline kinase
MALNKTRAIILAAGFGSRLMPYTEDRPKCMVSLFGKTILQRQIETLHMAGITDIAVVAGHCEEAVKHPSITEKFLNPEYSTTNMVVSLMKARAWLEGNDDILICYGDIVYTYDVLSTLLSAKGHMNVVIDKGWRDYWSIRMDNPLSDAETLKLNANGTIRELGKKPNTYDDIEGQYIGLQLWKAEIKPKILALYDAMNRDVIYDGKPFPKMFMTSFIQYLIDNGLPVHAAQIQNGWLEIDTVEDLEICERLHSENKLKEIYNDA